MYLSTWIIFIVAFYQNHYVVVVVDDAAVVKWVNTGGGEYIRRRNRAVLGKVMLLRLVTTHTPKHVLRACNISHIWPLLIINETF